MSHFHTELGHDNEDDDDNDDDDDDATAAAAADDDDDEANIPYTSHNITCACVLLCVQWVSAAYYPLFIAEMT